MALSRESRICPEPNLLNSYLLSWNRPIYDPVRCLGSKPDSILATAFMKLKSRPKASEARLISSTGVPTGVSLSDQSSEKISESPHCFCWHWEPTFQQKTHPQRPALTSNFPTGTETKLATC